MLRGSTQVMPNFLDVPFEIPCTESLASKTIVSPRWSRSLYRWLRNNGAAAGSRPPVGER